MSARSSIAPEDLVNRPAARIVDVRSPAEFEDGHVPGAINVPFSTAPFASLPFPPGEALVVYCGHGPRAWWAGAWFRRAGFTVVYLSGHMARWRREGRPLERGAR